MAVYFECQINKNALFETVFLAILTTGNTQLSRKDVFKNDIPFVYKRLE